ncbi:hypothetical protein H0266_17760 [Halobacillus locisalis]|uniref:Uncharacterized protein n=1 Tax=Halobacillus locisalis TaxID=220753 RepID=A0A838CY24_9BACI|nr:hypothetical protein [Halobacillus locisalis]MBA2176739.1 hypothetical protein [Halobacillus locisalis]
MGCCSPNSHEQVKEQEEKVNENDKPTVPVWVKIVSATLVITAISFQIW